MQDLIKYIKKEKYVNIDMLRKVSARQNTDKPGFHQKKLGADPEIAWDTVDVGGWRIQQRKQRYLFNENNCRIINWNDQIVSWGTAEEYITLIEDELRIQRALSNTDIKGYGLVLEGGGGKGAFEIGVWRYLKERNVDKRIKGISGASVGALNSLLFIGADYQTAKNLWENIEQNDMTPINLERFIQILLQRGIVNVRGGALSGLINLNYGIFIGIARGLKKGFSNSSGIFSQNRLEKIMADGIDWEQVNKSRIISYCSLSETKSNFIDACISLKITKTIATVFRSLTTLEYCCLNGLEMEKIRDLVLASAALPIAYGSRFVSGREYLDGGIQDNCPVKPLIEAGFKRIIVVHLHSLKNGKDDEWESSIKDINCAGVSFFHVYPEDKAYDNFKETMTVNPEACSRRMNQGYEAAKKQLSTVF